MFEVKGQQFNGPLALLLQLIEDKKMEITEVSLSETTEEFLAYIEKMEEKNAEELADFLMVAARLLLIKSKALLPFLGQAEELDDLEKQLKLYKQFVEASKLIEAMLKENRFTFSRQKAIVPKETVFTPPVGVTAVKLRNVFLVVLKKLDPIVKLPRQAIEKTVSLQQKILQIREFLNTSKRVGFRKLMSDAKSKTEVIVNFLAILELLKQSELRVRQKGIFEDIILEKI
jgi:segregation and condensation protein A